ncbi:MAG: PDZ domain-containing protein [Candidatus Korobacteraceae bacterium]
MRTRNRVSLVALFVAAMILPAMADPAGQPWPEAHSGAYLGVQITAVTPQRASALKLSESAGAIITYVDQDGPACHAGLMENDVVVAFEGSKIDGPEQLQGLIHATAPQKTVTLTIMRNGQRKEMKVTLGSWNVMSHAVSAIALGQPPPPHAYMPDLEIPSFTVISARHGLVVESLSPQLSDFFGVPRGQGVLVRSVEGGSPAAAAGLKAGDVIVKVNNDTVHDMTDWQRGMHGQSAKIPLTIWRDKHEQTMVMTVPGSTSQLDRGEWLNFDTQAQALRDQLEQMQPEIESGETVAQLGPNEKELEQMRSEMEKSLKLRQKDIDKMTQELAQSARPTQKEMEQLRDEIQRSVPSQKDLDEMTRHIQQSVPTQQQLDDMKRQIQSSLPSQKDLEEMRRQIESSSKEWTPKLQQQMEELKKQMEQQKFDLQKMLQEFKSDREF